MPPTGTAGRGRGVTVSVDDLEPGMVLAEEVRDQQGRLLMPADTELTERHLRAFQLWGILSVRTRSAGEPPEPESPPVSPELLARGEVLVRARLRGNDPEHPLIAELIRLASFREARRLSQEAARG